MKKEAAPVLKEKSWNIELIKLMYDYIKHITTLCTGSILIVVAFNERLAIQPSWKGLLKTSLVLFIVSIVSASITLLGLSVLSDPEFVRSGSKEGLWGESKVLTIAFIMTWTSFVLGLLSLVTFGFKNL